MTRTRSRRPLRLLLAAGLLAAASAVVPATAAQASTHTFTVSVKGGYNNTESLGTASGTVSGTRGGTTASYSVKLCGQNTYPSSTVSIVAGGARASHTVSYSNCQTFTGTLRSASAVSGATITVSGGTFYPGNTYRTYQNSTSVSFSGGTTPPPANPTPVTRSVSLAVTGASQSLGTATGTITAARGGTTARYSVKLCGQNTYPNARVTIVAGSARASHEVSYSNCQTFSGTLSSSTPFSSATATASGSTFSGSSYVTFTDSSTVHF